MRSYSNFMAIRPGPKTEMRLHSSFAQRTIPDVVGTRQAGTFAALSALSGHTDPPEQKTSNPAKKTKNSNAVNKGPRKAAKGDLAVASEGKPAANSPATANSSVGLTVRIEVNLPASGDQETYDNIFRSIRKNLLNDG
jgi:hypothetical protein